MGTALLADADVIERILGHIDARSTDLADHAWREPVAHYRCPQRLAAEQALLRRLPIAFCPSAAIAEPGDHLARAAAGVPIIVVRGEDGTVRAFRNACRHRGTALATGQGRAERLVCPYHGWTYGLDGALQAVPHAYGFPDLDKSQRGLIQLGCREAGGLVFVNQAQPFDPEGDLDGLPTLIPPEFRVVGSGEQIIPANWKVFAEGFLEGYHIRATHETTFYPRQYDNLNVVERFGRHDRIAFPYRNIERLRDVAPAERSAESVLTFVYHLFPSVMVATFRQRRVMVILEPVDLTSTRSVTFNLSSRPPQPEGEEAFARDVDFVNAGALEDREIACAIQRGLDSGANDFFEFGRFESALAHFHACLDAAIEPVEAAGGR